MCIRDRCNGTAMPKNWILEDGTMKVFTAEGKKPGEGSDGDIVFGEKKFKNFELSVDWKASKMANSGIFYNVREVPGKPIYYAAPEIQILDNVDATDNKVCLLYTSPSPRDRTRYRMPSSA